MAIIWTKHAIERNKERQITTSWIEKTINSPDQSIPEGGGRTKFIRPFGNQKVSVITTKTNNGEYLILSAWIDPPNAGTSDYKREKYQNEIKKSGVLKRFLLTFLHQIGI